jgi:hypothetical protein
MKERTMRIGVSLALIAIGAILRTSVSGVALSTVGVVLTGVGIIGLVLTILMATTARESGVVHHSGRRDFGDPTTGDDAR